MPTLDELRALMAGYGSAEPDSPLRAATKRYAEGASEESRRRGLALLSSERDPTIPGARILKLKDIDAPAILWWTALEESSLDDGRIELELEFSSTVTANCDYVALFAFASSERVWDGDIIAIIPLCTRLYVEPGVIARISIPVSGL